MPARQRYSRRKVLAGLAGTLAAGAASDALAAHDAKTTVVRVESPTVWKGERRDPQVIREMVQVGLLRLTGESTPAAAWNRFLRPDTKVGLKINLLGAPAIYTAPEITEVVAAAAIAAGIAPADLIVWDRYQEHFRRHGVEYTLGAQPSGFTVRAGGLYDSARQALTRPGPAPIDTLAAQATEVTINLPVLKDHNNAGVTGALKNVAFGCFSHPDRAHEDCCDPYIAEAYAHFVRHNAVPLVIMDATRACFEGGPRADNPAHRWKENAIYLATDPVAIDFVAMQRIMRKRREMDVPDKTAMCIHLATAAAKGLGTNDPARIALATVRV